MASCWRGALPPVLFRPLAVCFVRAIAIGGLVELYRYLRRYSNHCGVSSSVRVHGRSTDAKGAGLLAIGLLRGRPHSLGATISGAEVEPVPLPYASCATPMAMATHTIASRAVRDRRAAAADTAGGRACALRIAHCALSDCALTVSRTGTNHVRVRAVLVHRAPRPACAMRTRARCTRQ